MSRRWSGSRADRLNQWLPHRDHGLGNDAAHDPVLDVGQAGAQERRGICLEGLLAPLCRRLIPKKQADVMQAGHSGVGGVLAPLVLGVVLVQQALQRALRAACLGSQLVVLLHAEGESRNRRLLHIGRGNRGLAKAPAIAVGQGEAAAASPLLLLLEKLGELPSRGDLEFVVLVQRDHALPRLDARLVEPVLQVEGRRRQLAVFLRVELLRKLHLGNHRVHLGLELATDLLLLRLRRQPDCLGLTLPAPRILAGLLGGALRRPHLLFEIGHDRSMRHGELGDLAGV